MATVSGTLRYDKTRMANPSIASQGIGNVPIVLQNTATNMMLTVTTDTDGNYTFINVPEGNYRIVEAYGTPATSSPGDFSTAGAGNTATATFPPISFAPNPPANATNLDGTTPNTLFVTVTDANLNNQDILNGPVQYSPISTILDNNVTIFPANLITNADNGTFGTFPQGTPANTGAESTAAVPFAGEYTIQNMMTNALPQTDNDSWWRVADHTSGNETGRMMVVNGATPGAVIFEQKVAVKPLTYYLFSTWILNLIKTRGMAVPKLGVEVLASDGTMIYNATLGVLIPENPNTPEWKQIGTLLDTKNNTSLTIRFTSEGSGESGNDYVIDDIALQEIQIAAYTPQKSANTVAAQVGDTVTYTATLNNTGRLPLTGVIFQDAVPGGFTFVPGTVTINGTADPAADPNIGFSVPDILGGNTMTVTFSAHADTIPTANPAINTVDISYSYSPVEGGIPNRFDTATNPVPITVSATADLMITISADKAAVRAGDPLTYAIGIANNGPGEAQEVNLIDSLSSDLTGMEYSTDGGTVWKTWSGNLLLGNMENGTSISILIRGTVSAAASGILSNTATVVSPTPDPNPGNNSSIVNIPVTPPSADLQVTQTADQTTVQNGNLLIYTISVTNNGPDEAQAVTLADTISPALINPQHSIDDGTTWLAWTGTLGLGAMASNAVHTILIRGTVAPTATGLIANTVGVESSTPDPISGNNSSVINTSITQLPAAADLAVTKTVNQIITKNGKPITYTITVTNNGPDAAQNVVVTDTISSDLTDVQYSINGGTTWLTWTGTLNLGTMDSGLTRSILILGTVSPTAIDVLINTVTVESPTPDPYPHNNSSITNTPIAPPSADLTVTQTADHATMQSGDLLTYTLTVTNNGPDTAQAVTLSDAVSQDLTGAQYSADDGTTWLPWTGTLNLGTMDSTTSHSILIRGIVSSTAVGIISNTATVESLTSDPDPHNNSSVVNTSVTPPQPEIQPNPSADLSITKRTSAKLAYPGNLLTYAIQVTNNGPDAAASVVISDTAPSLTDVEYSTDSGRTWKTWDGSYLVGTLAASESVSILIRGIVSRSSSGSITNTAKVESTTLDPNQPNNTATTFTPVIPSTNLVITKTACPEMVKPCCDVLYTIIISNTGTQEANDVLVTDCIPDGIYGAYYSVDYGDTWDIWNGSLRFHSLPACSQVTLLINATISNGADGVIKNDASVSVGTPTGNMESDHAQATIRILGNCCDNCDDR